MGSKEVSQRSCLPSICDFLSLREKGNQELTVRDKIGHCPLDPPFCHFQKNFPEFPPFRTVSSGFSVVVC